MRGHFLRVKIIFLCLIILSVISGCSVQRPDAAWDSSGSKGKKQIERAAAYRAPASEKEPVRVDYLTLLSRIVSPEIYIYKEKRRLYVVQSNVVVRDYPITIGPRPVGDKQTAEDGRTPEGDFHICSKTPGMQSSKTLVIDYPGKRDAECGLSSGIISPPDTKPGGEVSIHAEDGQDNRTQGDIELYRSDMRELFKVASIGTPVHIRP